MEIIDIFTISGNIAIEINGNNWHTPNRRKK